MFSKAHTLNTRQSILESSPLSFADVTLIQALLHSFGHIRWNNAPELIQVCPINGVLLAKSSVLNIIVQPKESLRDLLHARILTSKPGNEECIITARVELGMHSPLRKDGHLVRG